jgi:hypothetical protein
MREKELSVFLKNIIKFWEKGWEYEELSKWKVQLLLFFRGLKIEDVSELRLLVGRKKFISLAGLFKFNYKEYLKTEYWQTLSKELKEKKGKCQICSSQEKLEVHHNNYKYLFLETEDDLTVLCRKCHSKFHDKEEE